MKITKTYLKQLIREELSSALFESEIEKNLGLDHRFSNKDLILKLTQSLKDGKFKNNTKLAKNALNLLATRTSKAGEQGEKDMVASFQKIRAAIKKQAGISSGVPKIEYTGSETPYDQTFWYFKINDNEDDVITLYSVGNLDAEEAAEQIADQLADNERFTLNPEDPSTLKAIKDQINKSSKFQNDQEGAANLRTSYIDRDTGGYY